MEEQLRLTNPQAYNELKNIRNMIRLITDNLDNLNGRFAGMQHPPKCYVTEYEQLTTKLNEVQNSELKLLEQLYGESSSDQENENHNDHNCNSHNSDSQYSPLDHQTVEHNQFNFDTYSRRQMNEFSNLTDLNANLSQSNHFNSSSNNNTPPTPKSPFKSIVRAHLPNNQRTTVQVFLYFYFFHK